MSDFVAVSTIVANVLTIAVNLWVLYQVRLLIGKELSKAAKRIEEKL
jgi:hypothetical protein